VRPLVSDELYNFSVVAYQWDDSARIILELYIFHSGTLVLCTVEFISSLCPYFAFLTLPNLELTATQINWLLLILFSFSSPQENNECDPLLVITFVLFLYLIRVL